MISDLSTNNNFSLNELIVEKEKNPRYEEMVCRLKPEERKRLETTLNTLSQKEEKIAELCKALTLPTFTEEIFHSPDLSFYALEAYKKGLIDEYQFGTIQLFWSIGQYHNGYHDMKVYPLFQKDGQINPQAVKQIQITLKDLPSLTIPFDFDTFINEMRKQPSSEQNFFVVPDIQPIGEKRTVSQKIKEVGINVFSRLGNGKRIVPSVGMMQSFLNAKENSVKINPVLGISTTQQMCKVEQRDMALPFPGVALPKEADGFMAPWYDFSYHDFYHAISCSELPLKYRLLIIKIARVAPEIIKELNIPRGSPEYQTLRNIYAIGADMEIQFYPMVDTMTPEIRVWDRIQMLVNNAFDSRHFKRFNIETALLFLQRATKKLILDGEGSDYGLTKDSLQRARKLLPRKSVSLGCFNLLQYMANAITNPLEKIVIDPSKKIRMDVNRFLYIISEKIEKEDSSLLQKRVLPAEQLSPLPEKVQKELIKNIHAVAMLCELNISLSELLCYDSKKRKEIFQSLPEIATLLLAGISLKELLELSNEKFKKAMSHPVKISELLATGLSLDQSLEARLKFLKPR